MKQILNDAMIAVEKEMPAYYEDVLKKDREILKQKGIKVVQLNDDEAKQYVDMAYQAVWNDVEKTAPDYAAKFRAAFKQ